jgi:hypothetical protein
VQISDLVLESSHSIQEPVSFVDMGAGSPPYISPSLWKAYGYWARPTVNEVIVHNASMFFLSDL